MKTPSFLAAALFAFALTSTAAFAAPAGKATPYLRGSMALKAAAASTKDPVVRAHSMVVQSPGRKFTTQVKCTPERMQNDAACRAHCSQ